MNQMIAENYSVVSPKESLPEFGGKIRIYYQYIYRIGKNSRRYLRTALVGGTLFLDSANSGGGMSLIKGPLFR